MMPTDSALSRKLCLAETVLVLELVILAEVVRYLIIGVLRVDPLNKLLLVTPEDHFR